MLRVLSAAIAALLLSPAASARSANMLDPLTRAHVGLSWVGSYGLGLTGGFDARVTRFVYMDMGGFGTPSGIPEDVIVSDGAAPSEYFFLRHGLYVAPGFRVPHKAGDSFNWDLLIRGGFAGVWWADVHEDTRYAGDLVHRTGIAPSLFGGLELVVQKGPVGLRAGAKAFGFKPYDQTSDVDVGLVRPQLAAEVLYQW